MSLEAATMDRDSEPEARPIGGEKTRLLTLADLDRRTRAYQCADRLHVELLSDLGGERHASTGQRELAQRAAVLGAIIQDSEARYLRGEPVDLNSHLASLNAYRRLLSTIGLERRARPVQSSLRERVMGTVE